MKRKARATRSTAAAVVMALSALPMLAGCYGNSLPQIPVPRPDEQAGLPRWYPERPWTASGGDSRIYIQGKIIFDSDRATIRPGSSEKVLLTLLQFVRDHPEVTLVRVEGHTDSRASDQHNMELSAKRSLTVCDWL